MKVWVSVQANHITNDSETAYTASLIAVGILSKVLPCLIYPSRISINNSKTTTPMAVKNSQ